MTNDTESYWLDWAAKMPAELVMARIVLRTGKKVRPKTAIKGKRFRCAGCRKRSPKPVKTPAPWYCPACRAVMAP